MTYMLLLNCALKLVEEIILYYDARSKKHQTTIVAPPSNANKWQMGFNSAFKGLIFTGLYYFKRSL